MKEVWVASFYETTPRNPDWWDKLSFNYEDVTAPDDILEKCFDIFHRADAKDRSGREIEVTLLLEFEKSGIVKFTGWMELDRARQASASISKLLGVGVVEGSKV